MRLDELVAALDLRAPVTGGEAQVRGVTHQADWVREGDIFVAIKGAKVDGHTFIPQAVAAGAVAVFGEGLPEGQDCPVPYAVVPNARGALADAAAELSGHPSAQMTTLGVTGTDGKTTTSCLLRHLLRSTGMPTGLLSTIGYELTDGVLLQPPTHFTTPEAPQVQQILRDMVTDGASASVIETSSHALALQRVRAVDYDVAVWTNLTGEHLDFHGTMERYFTDKAQLVQRARAAVLNADDPWTPRLAGMTSAGIATYSPEGVEPGAVDPAFGDLPTERALGHWWGSDVQEHEEELRFRLHGPGVDRPATLPMIGRFNVANALAALVAGVQAGADIDALVDGLATFPGVAGRMEMIEREDGDPRVIVDFAHTADSLQKALETVRVTTEGELWVLLGSAGGPRDPSKRAPLGATATAMADHVIFSEEDHRDTPLIDILNEMERGAREAGRSNFASIGNRVEAIQHVVDQAAPQDTIVLAGKGPEETLERDTETIPWNEVEQARTALRNRRAAQG